MEIFYLDECDSTQLYLKSKIQNEGLNGPILIYTNKQTSGVGSRGNSWIGNDGNLFFSFAISKNDLPNDLLVQSASIYFSFLLKEILSEMGSNIWVKWPNDFYLNDLKIGGTITSFVDNYFVCGIGLNLIKTENFGSLDIQIEPEVLLKKFATIVEQKIKWKEVFIKFEIEFCKSRFKYCHSEFGLLDMSQAILRDDGSIEINDKKVYSLR